MAKLQSVHPWESNGLSALDGPSGPRKFCHGTQRSGSICITARFSAPQIQLRSKSQVNNPDWHLWTHSMHHSWASLKQRGNIIHICTFNTFAPFPISTILLFPTTQILWSCPSEWALGSLCSSCVELPLIWIWCFQHLRAINQNQCYRM